LKSQVRGQYFSFSRLSGKTDLFSLFGIVVANLVRYFPFEREVKGLESQRGRKHILFSRLSGKTVQILFSAFGITIATRNSPFKREVNTLTSLGATPTKQYHPPLRAGEYKK
jgi:hypothetical protein